MKHKVFILPNGRRVGARCYVDAWKELKHINPNTVVKGFYFFPEPAGRILQDMRNALQDRINIRGGCAPAGRKVHPDYQRGFIQDRNDLRDAVSRRVRVYQFRTPEVRNRFSHLLSDHRDF